MLQVLQLKPRNIKNDPLSLLFGTKKLLKSEDLVIIAEYQMFKVDLSILCKYLLVYQAGKGKEGSVWGPESLSI